MRILFYSVLGFVILIGLLGVGWIVWSKRKLRDFRLTDAQIKAVQDSQRGKRPMWHEVERKERER